MCQNRQVIVTSFGCCWYSGGAPQSPDCWSSCNVWGENGCGGMEVDSGIVIEDVCGYDMQNLGGRMVFMFMKLGILVDEAVVVAVDVMVVVAVGAISFSEKWCLSLTKVKCSGVGFGLVGGGG